MLNSFTLHTYLYCLVPIKEAYSVSPASANKYLKVDKQISKSNEGKIICSSRTNEVL